MTDVKLSALSTGPALADADLFYSARDLGGGTFTQCKQAASALRTYVAVSGVARTQRTVTASPITVASTDQVLCCNITSGSPTCTLPLASTRAGLPITFKDVGGQFLAHNLTISCTGGELIDGAATYLLANNYAGVTINPLSGGGGWFVT